IASTSSASRSAVARLAPHCVLLECEAFTGLPLQRLQDFAVCIGDGAGGVKRAGALARPGLGQAVLLDGNRAQCASVAIGMRDLVPRLVRAPELEPLVDAV